MRPLVLQFLLNEFNQRPRIGFVDDAARTSAHHPDHIRDDVRALGTLHQDNHRGLRLNTPGKRKQVRGPESRHVVGSVALDGIVAQD
ncbi:MAG: hypothetical protein IPK19_29790 [Chloroflexi bacterium]|nr:hypothetical protein [Chloroflexota bacterium]